MSKIRTLSTVVLCAAGFSLTAALTGLVVSADPEGPVEAISHRGDHHPDGIHPRGPQITVDPNQNPDANQTVIQTGVSRATHPPAPINPSKFAIYFAFVVAAFRNSTTSPSAKPKPALRRPGHHRSPQFG